MDIIYSNYIHIMDYIKKYFFYNIYYTLCNVGYNAFFFNNLYNIIFIFLYKFFYLVNVKYLDKGAFEYFGPFLLYQVNRYVINHISYLFFCTIYFVLFIQFFFILIILVLYYFFILDFYCVQNMGLIIIILLINFSRNEEKI